MTCVADLIAVLRDFPGEAEVYIRSGDSSWAALMCGRDVVLAADDDDE